MNEVDGTYSTNHMNPVTLAPPRGDSRTAMWAKSILGTGIGLTIALICLITLESISRDVVPLSMLIILSSLVAGAVQGNFLRAYTRPSYQWLGVTVVGWLIAYSLLGWPTTLVGLRSDAESMTPLVISICTSLGQALLLRRWVDRSFYWLWIHTLCWYIVFAVFPMP